MVKYYCDKCTQEVIDIMEQQEIYTISLRGGYGSVFGDGVVYKVDLCQQCFYRMLENNNLLQNKFFTDSYGHHSAE